VVPIFFRTRCITLSPVQSSVTTYRNTSKASSLSPISHKLQHYRISLITSKNVNGYTQAYNVVHQLGKDVTVNGYWLTKLTGQSFVRRIQQAESNRG